MQQILWGAVKEMFKGKFVVLNLKLKLKFCMRQKNFKVSEKQSDISKYSREVGSKFFLHKKLEKLSENCQNQTEEPWEILKGFTATKHMLIKKRQL